MEIPFFSLHRQHHAIHQEIKEAIDRVVNQGQFVLGSEVEAFEQEFANYIDTKHCIAVGNGLDAITISLKAIGICKDDEVIVPSHTFQATWLGVARAEARPVPVEVKDFVIDTTLVEQAITKKTKAIMPVHLYGHACAMDEINALATRHNLIVVEDYAQAHGTIFNGKKMGSFGKMNATSFYPTKNLGALGDGGAITTNDDQLAAFARAFRNYGSFKKDEHTMLGINSRLDELQAAILRVKLKHLDKWNAQRMTNAATYVNQLQGIADLVLPPKAESNSVSTFHQFVVQTHHRDKLRQYLANQGIATAIHYPKAIHLQEAYSYLNYRRGSLPIAERLSETILSLPIWPGLMPAEVDYISDSIVAFFKRL